MIRPANREDVPRIWELVNELADYEHLPTSGDADSLARHAFDENIVTTFVAEEAGRIIGYSISFPTYSTFRCLPGMWLEDIYVTPGCRGKGYGKALLMNLVEVCRNRGCARLEWSVLDWNEPSIRFYEAMGADVLPDWRICRVSL